MIKQVLNYDLGPKTLLPEQCGVLENVLLVELFLLGSRCKQGDTYYQLVVSSGTLY